MSADHDSDLERSVLRYVLAAPPSWRRLGDLRGADMVIPAHREILDAILELGARGMTPSSDRVIESLKKQRRDEAARVSLQLLKGDATPLAAVSGAVSHLRSLSRQRALKEPLLQALALVESGDVDAAKRAVGELNEKIAANADDDGWPWLRSTGDCVEAAVAALQRKATGGTVLGHDLLEPVGDHLAPGNLVVVAGDTGAGKSSLCLWMAARWAKNVGTPVGIVSVEDREVVWGRRMIAAEGNIDLVDPGRITLWQAEDLPRYVMDLRDRNAMRYAILEDNDVEHVTRYARGLVERQGCGLLVIDYLQEITDAAATRRGAPQHERIAGVARAIKRVAKTCKVPVILASQLSRPDAKKYREPTLYDIKGSGDVENMAEGIMLLWRDGDDEDANAFVKVAKLKDSGRRPRLQLHRNRAGALDRLVPFDSKTSATSEEFS